MTHIQMGIRAIHLANRCQLGPLEAVIIITAIVAGIVVIAAAVVVV